MEYKFNTTALCVTTLSDWDEPPRMRRQVSVQMARYCTVLYFQLYTTGAVSIIKDPATNVYVIKVGGYIKGIYRIRFLKKLFNIYQVIIIRKIVQSFGYKNNIAMNFQYDFTELRFINKIFKKRAFFINDDFVNIDTNDTESTRTKKLNDIVRSSSNSDFVFVSSAQLGKYALYAQKPYHEILSGHDFPCIIEDVEPLNNTGEISICFMGYVANNINYEWIEHILKDQRLSINFIGPVASNDRLSSYYSYSNLRHYMPLSGHKLYDFLKQFDVLIMPYSDEINNTMSSAPGKLFQYLATGRPIVSSFLPNLINLPDKFLYQSGTKEEFLNNILASVADDTIELRRARRSLAASHTWDSRGDQIWRTINEEETTNTTF